MSSGPHGPIFIIMTAVPRLVKYPHKIYHKFPQVVIFTMMKNANNSPATQTYYPLNYLYRFMN